MTLDLESIYQNLLGRPLDRQGIDLTGAQYWDDQYKRATTGENAISSADAIKNIQRDIGLSNEATVDRLFKEDHRLSNTYDHFDKHGLGNEYVDEEKWNTMIGNFGSLKDELAKNQEEMAKMFANANWGGGGGYGQTVGGVKTQNELPGWSPRTGGSSGFFGRGGNRFGLTTSSLNI